jgi:hypothetical protein
LLIFLLASLVPGCSPILLPILLPPSMFSILAGQSCEAETDVSNIALLRLLLRVVVVARYPCLGCCCYVVDGAIFAAGQSCEWWTINDGAAASI